MNIYLEQYTRKRKDDEVHRVLHSKEVEEITEELHSNLVVHLKSQIIIVYLWVNRGYRG